MHARLARIALPTGRTLVRPTLLLSVAIAVFMSSDGLTWIPVRQSPDVFHVYHLRRSGGHGVIAWLFGHQAGSKTHYNQCLPQPGGGIRIAEEWIARYPGRGDAPAFELASFEDVPLRYLKEYERSPATSVLVLRDPFNLFASRLKMIRQHAAHDVNLHARANRIDPELWKQYAREFVQPNMLRQAVRLNFNRWHVDESYRRQISAELGWEFNDQGFGSRRGWEFSTGSSFAEPDARALDLHERWRAFREDPEFLALFDEETCELARQIFGFVPELPCRRPHSAAPRVVERQVRPNEALQLALEWHRDGRYAEAEPIYRQLLELNLHTGKIANQLAVLLFQTGRCDEARHMFELAIAADPRDETTLGDYTLALEKLGDYEGGIAVCRRALERLPDNTALRGKLGWYLTHTKQYAEAIEHLRFVTERQPQAYLAWAHLATASFFQGDEDLAIAYGANALAEKDRFCTELKPAPVVGTSRRFTPLSKSQAREGRRIVAFSLWGDNPHYTHGAVRNAELVREIYPGWVARFYCGPSTPERILARLEELGSQVYRMAEEVAFSGTAWRFLVADDPSVERFICRDCDSRLNRRGKAAVDEWIESGKPFHIMRDAIVHCDLMLAGMWGGVTGKLPNVQHLLEQYFTGDDRSSDQKFLAEHVWPLVRHEALVHDTYYRYRGKPFPPGCELEPPLHVGAGIPVSRDPPNLPL